MSYYTLGKKITGEVPKTSLDLVLQKMQDALGKIYDQTDWSFQRTITYANWLCPGQVANTGTFTVTPYSPTVIADATATQAINTYTASPGSVFLTNLQFRNPAYSIYNIIGVGLNGTIAYVTVLTPGSGQTPGTYTFSVLDAGGPGTGATVSITVTSAGTVVAQPIVLTPGSGYVTPIIAFSEGGVAATFSVNENLTFTLDRPWLEPVNGTSNYQLYQAYFVAPVADFRKFIEVRDTTNAAAIDFWTMTQAELAIRDPQRTEFADPSFVVPAGVDQRPGSSTLGYQMFELWPQQLSYIPYSFSFRRRGIVPQTQTDFLTTTVPYPLTEELLEWRTLEVLYQFKEAQKEKDQARGSGANWMMLSQYAQKEYSNVLDKILAIDVNLNAELFTRIPGRARPLSNLPYSNQLGGLNVGGYPERDY